ncbi:MAG: hypothetical protein RBS80_14585 [Thermoguttaceae bacterium]|nr:hypothetical protein [Thermoguttaceae bacterium]
MLTQASSRATRPAGAEPGWAPAVAVTSKRHGDDQALAYEWPTLSDLLPVRAETWLHGLREDSLGPDLGVHRMTFAPGEPEGSRLRNFAVQLDDGCRSYRRTFSVYSLSSVAQRARLRLTTEKVLRPDDEVLYYLPASVPGRADWDSALDGPIGGAAADGVQAHSCSPPLAIQEASLSSFLAASEPLVDGWAGPAFTAEQERRLYIPAFVFDDVWAQGLRCARHGDDLESAGMWAGRLLRDSQSGELFLVVDGCIGARHEAVEERYSVELSGETWSAVRGVLRQRRQRLGRPHEILLGSMHGHNFLPGVEEGNGSSCATCPKAAECTQTTARASALDIDWHHCVFSWGQPWAILGVWGFNVRGEDVWQLYGLADGTLLPRSIRVVSGPHLR